MSKGLDFGYASQYIISKAVPEFTAQFQMFAVVHHTAASYIIKLAHTHNLTVFVNEDVYPDFYTQVQKLTDAGIQVVVCMDRLTVPKDTKTGSGNLYSVFTPFKNAVWNTFVHTTPIQKPNLTSVTYADEVYEKLTHKIEPIEIKNLCKTRMEIEVQNHTFKIHELPDLSSWYTNEEDALHKFRHFLKQDGIQSYKDKRDGLDTDGTSKMSVALAWGFVSARTLTHEIQKHFDDSFKISPDEDTHDEGAVCYISELIWREFYAYLLFHNPELLNTEFQKKFRGTITWAPHALADQRFNAWIKGETGYPIVDAAMHQLKKTGWMHNRARMIVASVLTKNFGVDWRWGQEYFRYILADIDEASNNGGWQWGASVGADPKPIRIFNAELQAETHDSKGTYRDKWLGFMRPEIKPIIEHKIAREEALKRYGLSHIKPRDF